MTKLCPHGSLDGTSAEQARKVHAVISGPHGSLDGRTSAETAGITISGPDKWRTLMGRAASFHVQWFGKHGP